MINNGFEKISHIDVFSFLCSVLSQHNKSIDCLVYITVNLWGDDGTDIAKLLWLPAYGDKATDELSESINSIGRHFAHYLADKGLVEIEHRQEFTSLEEWQERSKPPTIE